ncbi:unnamed protein product [Cylicocyclus nassatus]|uniref:Uncharacterized protein n=1 Tax=Cylicocyclus nassatus TaxID=53992 RepID=A0AA36MAM4_CYLNA|nr:unnamed protein product [Cylicocyclus nassatus]
MTTSSTYVSLLIVAFIVVVSYYFYKNHKYLTYVETSDTFDQLYLSLAPTMLSSIMENTCKWPVLPTVEVKVPNFSHRSKFIRCTAMNPLAELDDYGFLEIFLPTEEEKSSIRCTYQPISNVSFVLGTPKEIEFNQPTQIYHDQFVVRCRNISSPQNVIYERAFINVPYPSGPAKQPKFVKSNWEYPSLALLIFDSVSLNQFKATMPRTWKFLVDNDFVAMNMYNEVTHDINSNILSILKGGEEKQSEETFLWDVMKERQCKTYLSEEIGDFPSVLGNMSLDVEHDLRPFHAYAHATSEGVCTKDGHVGAQENIKFWRKALLHSKNRCHFSMHHMRALTRDPELLPLLDQELRESLEALKANGLFEDTVFALLSGTGNPPRLKDQLFTSRVEERTPLFTIKLPEKFLRKHYHSRASLQSNANRLVATKDIGITLMDIASGSPLTFVSYNLKNEPLNGTSLLTYAIPTYRSCDDANVPPHMCLCMDDKALLTEDYSSNSFIYNQLFEYVKTEVLKNDCIDEVINCYEGKCDANVRVLSLNPMVQQGIRDERDWREVRKTQYDMGMNYVEILVLAQAAPHNPSLMNIDKMRVVLRMRFRFTRKTGFEPVGSPTVANANHQCHAKRIEQYCEMCYYNSLLTDPQI